MARHGNDPLTLRVLASIGAELQEDRPATPEAQAQLRDSLDTLMASPAYLNANDPRHADIVAKVTALTARASSSRPLESGLTMTFKA